MYFLQQSAVLSDFHYLLQTSGTLIPNCGAKPRLLSKDSATDVSPLLLSFVAGDPIPSGLLLTVGPSA